VLIPEILQTLFGYTATDAGVVLGPGTAVITILAPFVVRIVPRVGAPSGFSEQVLRSLRFQMFYYNGLTTQTDYSHFALARAYQLRICVYVRSSKSTRILLSAQEQEQQRLESDKPVPKLRRERPNRIRHHDAGSRERSDDTGSAVPALLPPMVPSNSSSTVPAVTYSREGPAVRMRIISHMSWYRA
jgi:hypothetical protein